MDQSPIPPQPQYRCMACKDAGYLFLPGFSNKVTPVMKEAPDNLYQRALAVGVATAYNCEFCNPEPKLKEEA